jgi:hypothetical protein
VEFPVGLLEGFGYPLHGLHDLQTAQKLHIHPAGIADEAQNSDLLTLRYMDIQLHILQPLDQIELLFLCGTTLQYCDHTKQLPSKKDAAQLTIPCGIRKYTISFGKLCSTNRYYFLSMKK